MVLIFLMEETAIGWLQSGVAAVVARRQLERLRLPANLADDVLQEARVRVWRQSLTHEDPPDAFEAVARRAIHQAAQDLHRKAWFRLPPDSIEELVHEPVGPSDVALPRELEDPCRRVVASRLARRPWVGAAALNEITFRLNPDVPIPDGAPAPDAGDDDHRVAWASMWLAGRFDCFPVSPDGDGDAVRQRRSRALAAVADELRAVIREIFQGVQ